MRVLKSLAVLAAVTLAHVVTDAGAQTSWRECAPVEKLLAADAVAQTIERAKLGFMCEQFAVGYAFELGYGTPVKLSTAVELYRQAALQRHAGAQSHLAWMYLQGRGVPRSVGDAESLLLQAEKNGFPTASLDLGQLYAQKGTELYRPKEAFEKFAAAAATGNATGEFELGVSYEFGLGTNPDPVEARKWLELAASHGEPRAHAALGTMIEAGQIGTRDPVKAFDEFLQGARGGVAFAQGRVGTMYRDGIGTKADADQAFAWLSEGAAGDDPDAQRELSALYAKPGSPRHDDFLAYYWQRVYVDGIGEARATADERRAAEALQRKVAPERVEIVADKLVFFPRQRFASLGVMAPIADEQRKAASDRWRTRNEAFMKANWRRPGVVGGPFSVQTEQLRAGTGATPAENSKVTVRYTLSLIDGDVVDSSLIRGGTVTFTLDKVVPGFVQGLHDMKVGGHSKLFIPADLGYAERGAGKRIPPNSTLIFDVELLSVEA